MRYSINSIPICSNIKSSTHVDKIVTGSLTGLLRVWKPVSNSSTPEASLLLESQLDSPILGIACGRFHPVSTVQSLCLAVLHPNSLVIYSVHQIEGAITGAYDSSPLMLTRLSVTNFGPHFSAYNMTHGPFGQSFPLKPTHSIFDPQSVAETKRESICVQSMDGQIIIIDKGVEIARKSFADTILPGPLDYCPVSDSLYTASSDKKINVYKLQSILGATAATSQVHESSASADMKAPETKSIAPNQVLNVGDTISHIVSGTFIIEKADAPGSTRSGPSQSALPPSLQDEVDHIPGIVASGDSSLSYILATSRNILSRRNIRTGAITQVKEEPIYLQKRMESPPLTIARYSLPPQNRNRQPHHALLVATPEYTMSTDAASIVKEGASLQVLINGSIEWAAVLPFQPVAMAVGTFGKKPGLICLLSHTGTVALSYLGSVAPNSETGVGITDDVETERRGEQGSLEQEYRELLGRIRTITGATVKDRMTLGLSDKDSLTIQADLPMVPDTFDDISTIEKPPPAPAYLQPVTASANFHPLVPQAATQHLESSWEAGLFDAQHSKAPLPVHTLTIQLAVNPRESETSRTAMLRDITLSISVPPWLHLQAHQRTIRIPTLMDMKPHRIVVPVRPAPYGVPSSCPIRVFASYKCPQKGDILQFSSFHIPVPPSLFLMPIAPIKTTSAAAGGGKFTVETPSLPAVPLTTLFPEFSSNLYPTHLASNSTMQKVASIATHVLSFRIPAGAEMTIITSKSGGRYRIQTNANVECLAGLMHVFCSRLYQYWVDALSKKDPDARVPAILHVLEGVPMAQVIQSIQNHVAARLALRSQHLLLSSQCEQYRNVLRRLLVRLRDKTATDTEALFRYLELVEGQVANAAANVQGSQDSVASTSNVLAAMVTLYQTVLRSKFPVLQSHPTAYSLLTAAFPTHVYIGNDATIPSDAVPADDPAITSWPASGWEENVIAALNALLKANKAPFKSEGDIEKNEAAFCSPAEVGMLESSTETLAKQLSALEACLRNAKQ